MDKDHLKLRKLVSFMRKEGVLKLKQGDLEINLAPSAVLPKEKASSDDGKIEVVNPYSEEDIVYWSVPGYSGGREGSV